MLELQWRSEPGWLVFRGQDAGEDLEVVQWPAAAGGNLASVVSQLWRLVEDEEALADGCELFVPHANAAAFPPKSRALLNLPEAPPVTLAVQHRGTLDTDTFHLDYVWYMTSGRPVVGPTRDGALLTIGGRPYLLPQQLFEVVEAIDAFNRIPVTAPDDRAAAWVTVQEFLPAGEEPSGTIDASRYLREVRIAHAGAFTLRPFDSGGAVDFDPVLFAAKPRPHSESETLLDEEGSASEPPALLPERYQHVFAMERFRKAPRARGRYVLEDGWILVLSPELRRAMEVVHRAQAAGGEVARDFVRNPRAYLKEALGDELEEHLIEELFKETREYSERVQEIGLWHKKVLPWVQVAREPWLPPEALGLVVDGAPVQLPPDRLKALIKEVEAALSNGLHHVVFDGVEIPVGAETLGALREVERAAEARPEKPTGMDKEGASGEGSERERHVLIVKNNFDEVIFNSDPSPRTPVVPPDQFRPWLKSPPKPHQEEGIEWLQQCWQTGWTGALLADDMGLGKTYQTLAFLTWLATASRDGLLRKAPILIVAPTGLLKNWEREHGAHLHAPGIGEVLRAYGADLRTLRRVTGARELEIGEPTLDVHRLLEADWVLTTYETLRDYQHSFGQVPFLAAVFDEAQKIKTPGTQITDAAKAMRAEFVLALTGTPVENRLADLWCIMDTLHPGALGDLRSFSSKYEAGPTEECLRGLKEALTAPGAGRPPVMLRRMKDEVLGALPPKTNQVFEHEMPPIQANAYASIVNQARAESGQGRMLEALQAMRRVSLAPLQRSMVASDDEYIRSSGRLIAAFDILDRIREREEKVLIFVEYREEQTELAGVIQRRYGLARTPMIISGDVTGPQRQARVDDFQSRPTGFDAIILSPKAGGVGITLTAANNVIHLTRWWNPAVEDQSTDRCYRIGQERAVNVYYPMAVIPAQPEHSFDRRLHALLERKRELSRDMLLPVGGTADDARKLYEDTTS